jgi:hypothetical protein
VNETGKLAFALGAGLFLSFIVSGSICNESLPPYIDPREVFSGAIREGYLRVYFEATNRYDETLEGLAVLNGEVEIVYAADPSLSWKIMITSDNLLNSAKYQASTGVLRVDAGETLRFLVNWDVIADNGVNLSSQVFRYWDDPDCSYGRCIAEEEAFIVRGSVTIFEKTGTITVGPTLFSLCHVIGDVGPNFCPPLDYTVPCPKKAVTAGPFSQRCPNP